MATSSLEPLLPPPSSTGKRILIGVAAFVAILIGTVITFGVALAGLTAIAIGLFAMRNRPKRITRTQAWMLGVGGALVPLLVLVGYTAFTMPTSTPEQSRREIAEARARQRDSMPEFLKKVMPNQGASTPAADSIADRFLANPKAMRWIGMFGLMFGSVIMGTIAGTFAWGMAMLLYHAIRGRSFESMPDRVASTA